MNQTFSLARFGLLLKRYVVENRKQLMFLYGIMWGVMMLLAACDGHHTAAIEAKSIGLLNLYIDNYSDRAMLYIIVFAIFSIVISSFMFSSLRSKQSRISALMLPASMTEKFWVNFVVYIVAIIPMFAIGVVLGDLSYLVTAGHGPVFSLLLHPLDCDFWENEMICFILLNQSIFAFGSALWPRLSFFKTFVAIFVVNILALFFPYVISHILGPFIRHQIICLPMLVLTAAFYCLAWWRFRHVQVIQKFL